MQGYHSTGALQEVQNAHFHAEYEILFIQKGWAEIAVGQKEVLAQSPCLVFFATLETHRIIKASPEYARYVLSIPVAHLQGIQNELLSLLRSRPADFEHVFSLTDCSLPVESFFLQILQESKKNDAFSLSCQKNLFFLLLVSLFRFRPTAFPAGKHHIPTVLSQIQHYLDTHFLEEISLEKAAEKFFVSPVTVRRLFRRFVGLSPKRYILLNRLSYARSMLENSPDSVACIAHTCGFSDSSHFIRCFKAAYGETPKAVKRKT